jgi:Domain of unknown function (DUF4193)
MPTDYDTARETDELAQDSLDDLPRRNGAQSAAVDLDETDAESFELPGADLSDVEFTVRVIPKRADEFTCSVCFLVHHCSQLARIEGAQMICRECVT